MKMSKDFIYETLSNIYDNVYQLSYYHVFAQGLTKDGKITNNGSEYVNKNEHQDIKFIKH
jgi:TRAP-type uncharacterized transport system substrate-binding protein